MSLSSTLLPNTAPATTKNNLGTLNGCYIPCLLNILGAPLFLFVGFAVGMLGWVGALALFCFSELIAYLTITSFSALVTNGKMRGGGAYYMISRSLGPAFGGSSGLLFWLTYCINVTFNTTAFTGVVFQTWFPSRIHDDWLQVGFSTATLFLLFLVAFKGAGAFAKVNYFIFAGLVVALIVAIGSVWLSGSSHVVAANLSSLAFTPEAGSCDADGSCVDLVNVTASYRPWAWSAEAADARRRGARVVPPRRRERRQRAVRLSETLAYSRWARASATPGCTRRAARCATCRVFSFVFPAVVDDEGANLSGDLADPGRSIPLGIGAVSTAFLCYVLLIFGQAGTLDRGAAVRPQREQQRANQVSRDPTSAPSRPHPAPHLLTAARVRQPVLCRPRHRHRLPLDRPRLDVRLGAHHAGPRPRPDLPAAPNLFEGVGARRRAAARAGPHLPARAVRFIGRRDRRGGADPDQLLPRDVHAHQRRRRAVGAERRPKLPAALARVPLGPLAGGGGAHAGRDVLSELRLRPHHDRDRGAPLRLLLLRLRRVAVARHLAGPAFAAARRLLLALRRAPDDAKYWRLRPPSPPADAEPADRDLPPLAFAAAAPAAPPRRRTRLPPACLAAGRGADADGAAASARSARATRRRRCGGRTRAPLVSRRSGGGGGASRRPPATRSLRTAERRTRSARSSSPSARHRHRPPRYPRPPAVAPAADAGDGAARPRAPRAQPPGGGRHRVHVVLADCAALRQNALVLANFDGSTPAHTFPLGRRRAPASMRLFGDLAAAAEPPEPSAKAVDPAANGDDARTRRGPPCSTLRRRRRAAPRAAVVVAPRGGGAGRRLAASPLALGDDLPPLPPRRRRWGRCASCSWGHRRLPINSGFVALGAPPILPRFRRGATARAAPLRKWLKEAPPPPPSPST